MATQNRARLKGVSSTLSKSKKKQKSLSAISQRKKSTLQHRGRRNRLPPSTKVRPLQQQHKPQYIGPITTSNTFQNDSHAQSNSNSDLSALHNLLATLTARHKNQHRSQPWWKWLGLLRKATGALCSLESEIESLQRPLPSSSSPSFSVSSSNHVSKKPAGTGAAEEVRRRLARETELVHSKEEWREWARDTVVPGSYAAFTALLGGGDVQFVNLGVVLVAIAAGVAGCVGLPLLSLPPTTSSSSTTATLLPASALDLRNVKVGSFTGVRSIVTGVDRGKVVQRVYGSDGDAGGAAFGVDADVGDDHDDNDDSGLDLGVLVQRKRDDDNIPSSTTASSTTRPVKDPTQPRYLDLLDTKTRQRVMQGVNDNDDDDDDRDEDDETPHAPPAPPIPTSDSPYSPAAAAAAAARDEKLRGEKSMTTTTTTKMKMKATTKGKQKEIGKGSEKDKIKKDKGNEKKKKKAVRKKNAIDDLFAGFL